MDRLHILCKIAPEIAGLIERRHAVLQHVFMEQPIGRRTLANKLSWPERMVRKEIEFLRQAEFIRTESAGMAITSTGERVLSDLRGILRALHDLPALEKRLARRLSLKKVVVVPGDADRDETVKKEIAGATANLLDEVLKEGDILAVTGGTTLAEVANSLPAQEARRDLWVVPARGGLGEDVELQANSVAAQIAERLGGDYRLLHVPDDLGEEAMVSIACDPKIRELLECIRSAQVLLHGIGTAADMARRRGLSPELQDDLKDKRAVGEALGYYFDEDGNIVHATTSVGLNLDDLRNINVVIAVGGGRSKAQAALAVLSTGHQDIYITDEGAARRMLELTNETDEEVTL
ncbi:MAG: sugar-binding transcriptional regulator [Limnochordia bacterium]|jgi:central glycolytic genes regulator